MKKIISLVALLCAPLVGWAAASHAAAAANGPVCAPMAPFYWEIGNATSVLASGAVTSGRKAATDRDTPTQIASASKWPYGAYVNQIHGGILSADDVKFLNLRSGWTRFNQCDSAATVGSCAAGVGYVRRTDGKFDYGGGHMQKHASLNGMDALNSTTLAAKINGTLGTSFAYSSPQLAGGIVSTPASYAAFMQRIMTGKLIDSAYLNANQVETSGPTAISSPAREPWHYGRGHWIELDGTFSSPGAFGFYPWISADKQLYGVLARHVIGGAWDSVVCGREIRKAFLL